MKKKLIAILLVCIMVMGFAACSNGDESGTQATAGNATQSTTETSKSTASADTKTPTPTTATEPTATPEVTPSEPTPEPIDAFILDFWHEDSVVYEDYFLDTAGVGTNCTWEWVENSGLEINITANDPFFPLDFGGDSFSLSEYPFMKIRIKNITPATTMEFFLVAGSASGAGAGDVVQYPSIQASTEEYTDYIIDLQKQKGDAYIGREVGGIRMDVLSLDTVASKIPEDGWTIAIDYIGFFPTAEAAQTYTTH